VIQSPLVQLFTDIVIRSSYYKVTLRPGSGRLQSILHHKYKLQFILHKEPTRCNFGSIVY